MNYLIPFAFLCAAFTALLNPFFFHEPSFFLYFLDTLLSALLYLLLCALGFLFAGALTFAGIKFLGEEVAASAVKEVPQ